MSNKVLNIVLVPTGDKGSSFRTRNPEGSDYRSNLIDNGESLVTQANIRHVAHGTLQPSGIRRLSSLLVFEFRFLNFARREHRRFKSATITVRFEDVGKNQSLDPVVYRIAPQDSHFLNPTTRVRDISQYFGGGISGGVNFASLNLGCEVGLQETKTSNHAVRVTGAKRITERVNGAENTAIWSIHENTHTKDGIPNFLRTSVLLKRKTNAKFRAFITIETTVDFATDVRRLVGLEGTDPVDPFALDPNFEHPEDLEALEIELDSMEAVDLMSIGGVAVAQEIEPMT
ncbi:hypothetical protein TWF730_006806 [Orbilia blumenaviensis]|uniref:Uncharacterized protein n=1 Tax=Orbilia blumenaviensis TaxID=1796055 RepID=A0AAV9VFC2_9PEZI